ncbi:hypothetical protein RFI_29893 [Reticulomyxa filosa]|uniref:J domain-containing protein n=1 Tax=Reticulomyxa filosa TaxID=46433 RepID=X6M0V9_RETFI|nr:hypothetical protein RFI_29893 [Reticulomyxa filosa]|eukprot:ETO07499.1 hypothetical protein RFI_29893 [Reticulomyxa filosa]
MWKGLVLSLLCFLLFHLASCEEDEKVKRNWCYEDNCYDVGFGPNSRSSYYQNEIQEFILRIVIFPFFLFSHDLNKLKTETFQQQQKNQKPSDRNPNQTQADREKYAKINRTYEILSDSRPRSEYDQYLRIRGSMDSPKDHLLFRPCITQSLNNIKKKVLYGLAGLSIVEAIILSLAQCYYNKLISKHISTLQMDIDFDRVINKKKSMSINLFEFKYVYIYDIGDSSRYSKKSSIFRKSICNGHEDTDNCGGTTWFFQDSRNDDGPKQFILLKQKTSDYTELDSKTSLSCRFNVQVAFQDKLKRTSVSDKKFDEKEKTASSNAPGEIVEKVNRSAVLWLDEFGLYEQSPHRSLKVLHKLLEEEEDRKIGFIGLSNWRLDAAKVNRMVLHQVTQPNDKELLKTAGAIIAKNSSNNNLNQELSIAVFKITQLYTMFDFDFYGYRDSYSLASSLKYSCSVYNELINDLLIEAVMQNFGGMTQQQTDAFLFHKLDRFRDLHSTVYLYQTIERLINVMINGKLCILLKLEQLYYSLSMFSIKDTKPLKALQSSQEQKHLIETII